ncbi:MAG: glycosyltransferase family 2 protein [Candidatus Paceibacterota bacterium]
MKLHVSVCIICFNEETNIRRCLDSVKWIKAAGGEIVVIDSFSTDKTPDICREYTDKFTQNKWPGFVNQKNFALDKASHDWVLSLDADEVISNEAKQAVIKEAETGFLTDGYLFRRHTFYLGRWINHGGWYPDWKLRLFKKSKARWGGLDPHDRIVMAEESTVKHLDCDIVHHTYQNLSHQIKTIDRFSDASSEALMKDGKRFSLFHLLFRPPAKFLETYFYKLGILDGLPGLIIAVASSFYVFIKYAKMWERQSSNQPVER